jgi:putative addiction module CopG family antidote
MAINVSIDPNLEAFVMHEIEVGQYSSPAEVVNQSLEMMRARQKLRTYTKEEIIASLTDSEEQIARDEGFEASEVFDKLRERLVISAE